MILRDYCFILPEVKFDSTLSEEWVKSWSARPNHTLSKILSSASYLENGKLLMKIPLIDLKSQYRSIETEVNERIAKVLEHGHYIMGPEVLDLETKLAGYVGAKHCITVSSGTDALLISLMALGIKAGDEVVIASFTFVSTAEVVVLLGATPVFVDVEASTCNVNPDLIAESITEKTKAIIPVSLYGQPSDMSKINDIAAAHGTFQLLKMEHRVLVPHTKDAKAATFRQ